MTASIQHLRAYQQAAILAVTGQWAAGVNETLLVMATGGGKTQTFLRLLMDALDADPNARALIMAHRKELIDQPLERIKQMDSAWLTRGSLKTPRVGVIQAERRDMNRPLTIATVQSLNPARLAELLSHGPITHFVVDECHHATAQTYLRVREALLAANPNLLHLGVTATPLRADGDGLAKVYKSEAYKVSIADLVRDHYLVQPRWLAIKTGISLKGVHSRGGDYVASELADRFDTPAGRAVITQAYMEYAKGRRAIAFTASVQGAHDLADAFRERGLRAAAIDGETPPVERAQILAQFRAGAIDILTNCQVLTEGFDAPGTSCVLMCRPTRSDSLYVQCMGRGLRPANGIAAHGEDCLILDFMPADTRNIVMAGDVLGVPKEQANAVRELLEEEQDELAQVGFTFDGDNFDYHGTAIEIIARQLDYLNVSRLAWFPPSGIRRESDILTVALGVGSDGYDRILAIRNGILYGIGRDSRSDRPGPWVARAVPCEDVYAKAEEIAASRGNPTLMGKASRWRSELLSDGQERYLNRLAKGRLTKATISGLSRGEAAAWITHLQAELALAGATEPEPPRVPLALRVGDDLAASQAASDRLAELRREAGL